MMNSRINPFLAQVLSLERLISVLTREGCLMEKKEKVFIIGEYDKIWERKKGCL